MDRTVKGRDLQLDVVDALVGATARGEGGVLLIEGPAGIGKTRMLAETLAVARRAGVRVEAFDDLLDGSELTFWLIEDLCESLERAALERPLIVALDDLQLADAGTLVALRALIPRTARLPIRWVFTGESRELLSRIEGAHRMVLGPLPDDAVAAVVADRLDAPGDPAVLQLAARARGNPFLLVELVEGLREEGRVTIVAGRSRVRGDELPARLAASMRRRLDRLGTDAAHVVQVGAVLGPRFSATVLATVLDRRPSQLLEPIDEALRADLLSEAGDHLSFRHELLREAVLGTLTDAVRRALQREAAAALIEHGDAARVARRLDVLGVRRRVPLRSAGEGWESLTESELRVVRLVGIGATNRSAAERLYLSPHTVSTHLRHAFAKLEINSRVELARLLHEHDAPALVG